ncbi:MAG: decaprenyl-phosphate phosphoribosyltransferase, partial [Mycobacterium sp.]|nr:decaprenyl-phosphate phosphoribosyltransferase [Mycobacterium sp.]
MSEDAAPVGAPPKNLATGLVKAMRPRQWVKNLLVFAAPLFAFGGDVHYDIRDVLIRVSIAFVTF